MQFKEQSSYVNKRIINGSLPVPPRSSLPHVSVLHVEALTGIAIIDVFFSLFSYPPIRNSRHSALLMQDRASNHISQWNRPLCMKQEVDLLLWLGSSSDHLAKLAPNSHASQRFLVGSSELVYWK